MKKQIILNIYPRVNTLKQRFTVIYSTLLGIPYHMWVDREKVEEILKETL